MTCYWIIADGKPGLTKAEQIAVNCMCIKAQDWTLHSFYDEILSRFFSTSVSVDLSIRFFLLFGLSVSFMLLFAL